MASTTTREVTARLAKKLLMPLVATGVTAAASYAGKKAPELLEEKLMPKLREATAAPPAARRIASEPADGTPHEAVSQEDDTGQPARRSSAQREQRREERAAHRAARRNHRS